MSDVKFTIMMPLFNHELYVEEAIKSVLNQNYENFELVICNDGSTDNSFEIAGTFSDDRIKFIDKPNGGCVSALNACILESAGDYICWLSSDDFFGKDKLNYHLYAHKNSNSLISIAPSAEFRGDDFKNIRYNIDGGITRMLPFFGGNPINGLAICAHRSMYLKYGLFDSRYIFSHDYERWLSFLKYEEPVYVDGEPQSFTRLGTSFVKDSNPFFNGDLDNFRVLSRRMVDGLQYFIPDEFKIGDEVFRHMLKKFIDLSEPRSNYFFRYGFSEFYIKALSRFVVKYNAYNLLLDLKESNNIFDSKSASYVISECLRRIEIDDCTISTYDFLSHLKSLSANDILSPANKACVDYYINKSFL